LSLYLQPNPGELLQNPELASLGLLRAALDTADCVLNLEYADLGAVLLRPNIERNPEVLVAAVLSQRFREIRQLLDMYVAATRRHLGDEHDVFDDLPF
jgi:hypothetical protein